MSKTKIAFICVHNSCRSQIAEALGRHLAPEVFECYSAGTELKNCINQDAVRLMKELYGIDMEAEGQHSKLLEDLPPVDGVITMGCNVQCPFLPCKWREDWGLEDPTGQTDQVFCETIRRIEEKILQLKENLLFTTRESLLREYI
ncbi:MAG: arsenate reductase ArsC [Fusicatenibacter sp.]|nr:arsenate reductase ArsC [Fusicatenibacter sp.]